MLSQIWTWLNGKKSTIATIYWTIVMPSLTVIYPNGIPSPIDKVTVLIGTLLGALGLGHKLVKTIQKNGTDNASIKNS